MDEQTEQPRPSINRQSRGALEIVALIAPGISFVCSLLLALLALTSTISNGIGWGADLGMLILSLGLALTSLSTMAMIWFRKRDRTASAFLALGLVGWFIGAGLVSAGGFAAADPGDYTILENLGWSSLLCFAPGGFLALLGLGLYIYDQRRPVDPIVENITKQPQQSDQPTAVDRDDRIRQAHQYLDWIIELIRTDQPGLSTHQAAQLTGRLDDWESHLKALIKRIETFKQDAVIQRDLQAVPQAIDDLEKQFAAETDPQLRTEIEETLTSRREQQAQLNALQQVIRRTDLNIDETMAKIATVYSQLQLLDARQLDNSRARRLSSEIEEEARRLDDLLAAMDAVYRESD